MTKEELKNYAELQNSSDRPVTNRDYFIDLFYPLLEAKDKDIAELKEKVYDLEQIVKHRANFS